MNNEETMQAETSVVEDKKQERGPSGQVGKATPALTLKQKWHENHFRRVDAGGKNTNKRVWVRVAGAPSLKQFARKLLEQKDPLAEEWFDCKAGALNESKSKKNLDRAAEEARSSKAARRKKSAGKNKADDTAAVATATLGKR